MQLYKNISNKTLKINNRILYPSQTIKLRDAEYNNYKHNNCLCKIIKTTNSPTINTQPVSSTPVQSNMPAKQPIINESATEQSKNQSSYVQHTQSQHITEEIIQS